MPHKILLADDNPNILSFVQPALEREGYGVVTAADGVEALYAWESEHPALLILDIEMPEPNGLAVCRKIRESGVTVLLVEHHMRLVMRVSDVVTVLDAGRVIASGSPDTLRRDPRVIAAYLGRDA